MKLVIVVQHRFELWEPPEWFAERLRREFPQVEVLQFRDYQAAEPYLPVADAMITWSLRPEQFACARRLRWIHSTAAAVHALLIPEIVASDVVVTNASSVHGPVVAEHAMAMILALARRLPSAMRYQQKRVWGQEMLWNEHPRPRELGGACLGLVGVGAIGGAIARLAAAFEMRLVAVREHPERGLDFLANWRNDTWHGEARVVGFDALDEVVGAADYLVLAAPLTPRTRRLITADRLRQMKPDACLINVSRGALVDENAMIQVLREGSIGGAALDVFEREPLPADSPLWELPNVLITPHSAGFTERMWERHYALYSGELRRFLNDEPLLHLVDKAGGY
ncbi:MAG: D-2-hydroxyacid dehydrogenase [Terriglobales bacterium]